MSLRIIRAQGSPYPYAHDVEVGAMQGSLADSIERISQKLHFESAPGLSTLNGSIFNSTEELQNDLLQEMQALASAAQLLALIEELWALSASGLVEAFEQALATLPAKAMEIYQEPGISRLFDSLPSELKELLPFTAEEVPLAMEKNHTRVKSLEMVVLVRQRALTARVVERENHAAVAFSKKGVEEFIKLSGVQNE